MDRAIAEDGASSINSLSAGQVREPSASFFDEDCYGSVIPWAAAEQHHAVEPSGCHE